MAVIGLVLTGCNVDCKHAGASEGSVAKRNSVKALLVQLLTQFLEAFLA